MKTKYIQKSDVYFQKITENDEEATDAAMLSKSKYLRWRDGSISKVSHRGSKTPTKKTVVLVDIIVNQSEVEYGLKEDDAATFVDNRARDNGKKYSLYHPGSASSFSGMLDDYDNPSKAREPGTFHIREGK